MSPDQERWAEALAIGRIHGDDASHWIAERMGALALAGDLTGVIRLREVARRYDQIRSAALQ